VGGDDHGWVNLYSVLYRYEIMIMENPLKWQRGKTLNAEL
jgi:hypothetical protein